MYQSGVMLPKPYALMLLGILNACIPTRAVEPDSSLSNHLDFSFDESETHCGSKPIAAFSRKHW